MSMARAGSVIASVIVAVVAIIAANQRGYRMITLSPGRQIALLSVIHDGQLGQILEDATIRNGTALVVSYYTQERNETSKGFESELKEVLGFATQVAKAHHDSLVVLEPTRSIGPKWSPFVSGEMRFFRRTSTGYLFSNNGTEDWKEISRQSESH
jgi:hypothetical protein